MVAVATEVAREAVTAVAAAEVQAHHRKNPGLLVSWFRQPFFRAQRVADYQSFLFFALELGKSITKSIVVGMNFADCE